MCGDKRRVISGRHLSKHGIDRETYMGEYHLSPDELCATDFRRLVSSRPDYYPHDKRNWIAAIKKIYKRDGQVFAGHVQKNIHTFTIKAFGFLVIGITVCELAVLSHKGQESGKFGIEKNSHGNKADAPKQIVPLCLLCHEASPKSF